MARFFYFAGGIEIVVFGVVLPIWQRLSLSNPAISEQFDLKATAYIILSSLLGSAITGLLLIAIGAILSRLDTIVANTSRKSDAGGLDTQG
jgi:hypothetical protein